VTIISEVKTDRRRRRRAAADRFVAQILERLDKLPDDSVIPDSVTSVVLGVSTGTLRRNPDLAGPPIKLSARRYGRRLGNVRAVARGTIPAA